MTKVRAQVSTVFRAGMGLALAALLSTCGPPEERPDCFKSTGPQQTEHRPLPDFQTIEVHDNVDVIIAADGQPYGADVTAGRNLLSEINTDLDASGKLVIRNRNKCNFVRSNKKPITVTLHLPDPGRTFTIYQLGEKPVRTAWPAMRLDTVFVHLVGSGDVDLDLDSKRIWFDSYEYGDVILHGRTDELNGLVAGVGWLRAEDLVCLDAWLTAQRDGDLHARATRAMGIYLNGQGNAYYYGEPAYPNFVTTSTGRIFKAD